MTQDCKTSTQVGGAQYPGKKQLRSITDTVCKLNEEKLLRARLNLPDMSVNTSNSVQDLLLSVCVDLSVSSSNDALGSKWTNLTTKNLMNFTQEQKVQINKTWNFMNIVSETFDQQYICIHKPRPLSSGQRWACHPNDDSYSNFPKVIIYQIIWMGGQIAGWAVCQLPVGLTLARHIYSWEHQPLHRGGTSETITEIFTYNNTYFD